MTTTTLPLFPSSCAYHTPHTPIRLSLSLTSIFNFLENLNLNLNHLDMEAATTLADQFAADLEELEAEAEAEAAEERDDDYEDDIRDVDMTAAVEAHAVNATNAGATAHARRNGETLAELAPLTSTSRYARVVGRVRSGDADDSVSGELGSFIVDCNTLVADMDAELHKVHGYVRDAYRSRFPELETLVMHPVDYARVVQRLILGSGSDANGGTGDDGDDADDITLVDLEGLLPSATIMVVTVTASTTNGTHISAEARRRCLDGCAMMLTIDSDRRAVQVYVEGKMEIIAPNLSRAAGSETAAQLMCAAGGLSALSKVPSCNIQMLGAKRKTLAGFSTTTSHVFRGFIGDCPIVTSTPPSLQNKAIRLVASKCALLARCDTFREDPTGATGQRMRDEMVKKIEKWQEPPPARIEKALPVPDLAPKKRRGGRRMRKMKERFGMTEARKMQNRLGFDFENGEGAIEADDEVIGLGSIGQVGSGVSSGSLRMHLDGSKSKLASSSKKQKTGGGGKQARASGGFAGGSMSSFGVGGLASSLAFTPVQGIELENPSRAFESDTVDGTKTYFSETSSFSASKIPSVSRASR